MNGFWVLSWHKWDDLYVRAHNNLLKWKYAHIYELRCPKTRTLLFPFLSLSMCMEGEEGVGSLEKVGFS